MNIKIPDNTDGMLWLVIPASDNLDFTGTGWTFYGQSFGDITTYNLYYRTLR